MTANAEGWLAEILVTAKQMRWCTQPGCGTCGAREFRVAYLRGAAESVGISLAAGGSTPRDFVDSITAAQRPAVFEAIVGAVAALSPEDIEDPDPVRTILMDLDPPF